MKGLKSEVPTLPGKASEPSQILGSDFRRDAELEK